MPDFFGNGAPSKPLHHPARSTAKEERHRIPKPETRNLEPETWKPEPEARNPKPEIENRDPKAKDPVLPDSSGMARRPSLNPPPR